MGRAAQEHMGAARWIAAVGLAAWLGPASVAHAQHEVTLAWSAPTGCPDRAAVEAELARLLGGPTRGESSMDVRGTMVRRGELLVLEIETRTQDGEGTRTLEGATCEALTQAGALVIAMAIDPDAVAAAVARESTPEPEIVAEGEAPEEASEEAPAARPEPSAEPEVPPSDLPPAAIVPRADEEASRGEPATREEPAPPSTGAPSSTGAPERAWFVARASAVLGVGTLPDVAPGVAGGVGARIGIVEVLAEGVYLAETEVVVAGSRRRGGSFGFAAGRIRGCVGIALVEMLELAPCLALEGGAMWGRGEGVPLVRTGTAPWVALTPGAELRAWVLDALAVVAHAELQVPFVRPDFSLEVGGEPVVVHAATEVTGLFGVGLMVRLD